MAEAFAPKGKILSQKLQQRATVLLLFDKSTKNESLRIYLEGETPCDPQTSTHIIDITYIDIKIKRVGNQGHRIVKMT